MSTLPTTMPLAGPANTKTGLTGLGKKATRLLLLLLTLASLGVLLIGLGHFLGGIGVLKLAKEVKTVVEKIDATHGPSPTHH